MFFAQGGVRARAFSPHPPLAACAWAEDEREGAGGRTRGGAAAAALLSLARARGNGNGTAGAGGADKRRAGGVCGPRTRGPLLLPSASSPGQRLREGDRSGGRRKAEVESENEKLGKGRGRGATTLAAANGGAWVVCRGVWCGVVWGCVEGSAKMKCGVVGFVLLKGGARARATDYTGGGEPGVGD